MSEQDWAWNNYVETGKVSVDILKDMVKIIKSGGILSVKYLSIYKTHSNIIEIMLKKEV
jgi:hypothetical protein